MSVTKRTSSKLPHPGPYIARITSHLDPTFMGGVEAVLEQGTLNNPEFQDYVFPLQYLSPFYGVTSSDFEGADEKNFYDVQKSYGMWMVPPDVGTRVLCIFVNGDPNQGFWIGCIADRNQNHMIPGIAASAKVAWAPGQKEKYDVDAVPVAEFHRKKIKGAYEPNSQLKPVHPFADRLLTQGLLADAARGVTSSSARREFPSRVFGISTAGAPDGKSPVKPIGYKNPGQTMVPTSRLPGHQFVMDDGDKSGENKLVRLRSGGGHQILLNDSQNIIYIANAEGTAWMEFTASGKIDIYAKDSVSIHSEADFNFRADRDINLEALRNVNIRSRANTVINSDKEFNLRVLDTGKIYIAGNYEQYIKGDYNTTVEGTINFLSKEKMNLTGKQDLSVITQGKFTIAASGGTKHGKPGDIADAASAAIRDTTVLKEWMVPRVTVGVGWPKRKYQDSPVPSIMQRVPMHEPWSQHESLAPDRYNKENTDVNNIPTPTAPTGPNKPTETSTFSTDAWFDFDKSVLLPAGETALTQFAEKLQKKGGTFTITIIGHADSMGTDSYNQSLSVRRATAAKDFLVSKGLPASSISATGKGESSPIAPNTNPDGSDNPDGRAQNRRVEIKVVQETTPKISNANAPVPAANPNMPTDWAQDTAFINKVKEVSAKYKMDYVDMLAVMMMESGVSSSRTGPNGATGLIQFTEAARPSIGDVTLSQLRGMTREQQMHYVDMYFSKSTPGLANLSSVSLNDIYMSVFAPYRGFGKPDDTILYSDNPAWLQKFPSNKQNFERLSYTQNSALDKNGDRAITKAEACRLLLGKRALVTKALGL